MDGIYIVKTLEEKSLQLSFLDNRGNHYFSHLYISSLAVENLDIHRWCLAMVCLAFPFI